MRIEEAHTKKSRLGYSGYVACFEATTIGNFILMERVKSGYVYSKRPPAESEVLYGNQQRVTSISY
ncbi:hypothetical protein [Priestia megaterium]|uniref:hypothetical protein n=1 Tax=Priestia megaterium TaxID=1404 RepID=UPI0028676A78|nr:hypothetical protein [Priestia megaterium]MDR7244688.1 hypothetical protein [Priestia megaterium]